VASRKEIIAQFPGLRDGKFQHTSDPTIVYNCIAWALGITDSWCWPTTSFGYYWPHRIPISTSVESFVTLFGSQGYVDCENGEFESGVEKIAIYAKDGNVKHAARQLINGRWTSKLGEWDDIMHTKAEGLECDDYGKVVRFMKRPRAALPASQVP
jgi:hypothetical protein